MFAYIAQCLVGAVSVLFVVSLVSFGLYALTPGDPAVVLLEAAGIHSPPPDAVAAKRIELHLDGGQQLQAAIAGAVAAFVVTMAAGTVLHKPLSFVPENFMKFVVGAMLTTFGIFWGAEGLLVEAPLADATLLVILGGVCLTSFVAVRMLAGVAPQGAQVAARNI